MVDMKADLEIVLKFIAARVANSSIYQLFETAQEKVAKCLRWDIQKIGLIADIMAIDPNLVHVCPILQGYDFEKLKKIKRRTRDSTVFNDSNV